jgi:glycosyltransferase involved in cell wall biosynthesis
MVMSVYNGEPYLIPALESITAQTFTDFNAVVVDDGSTDRSASLLEEYSKQDTRIKVIHQQNAGVVASLNRACALVQTPYIARLDADDVSVRDRLERQLDFLRRNPQVALLGGAANTIDETGRVLFRVDVPTSNDEIKMALPNQNVFVSGVVIRRDALLALGGYRRAFQTAEDYDLWLRLSELYDVANLSDVVVHYRVHPRQTSTTQLERQVMAIMGARLSAKFRRAKENDPFGSMDQVGKADLCHLGVAPHEIETEIARVGRSWARVMEAAGYHETAIRLAKEAWRRGRGRILTRGELGRFYFMSARASVLRKERGLAFGDAFRAVRWHPALLWRMLRGGVRKLTGW